MIVKCAGPACSAQFHNVHEGKLFITEVERRAASDGVSRARRLRYYWLCDLCSRTVAADRDNSENKATPGPVTLPACESAP
jgi:hypothetical protein